MIDRVYDAALRPGGVERNETLRDRDLLHRRRGQGPRVDVRGASRRGGRGRRLRGVLGRARLDAVDPGRHPQPDGVRRVHAVRLRGHLAVPLRCGSRGHGRGLEPSRRRAAAAPAARASPLAVRCLRRLVAAAGGRRCRARGAPLHGGRPGGLPESTTLSGRLPPARTSSSRKGARVDRPAQMPTRTSPGRSTSSVRRISAARASGSWRGRARSSNIRRARSTGPTRCSPRHRRRGA